jgi:hypothetical protein
VNARAPSIAVAWTGVQGSFRLEQWQHPLGTIGGPVRDNATIFVAQRYPIGLEIDVRWHFSTVVTRVSSFFTPSTQLCVSRQLALYRTVTDVTGGAVGWCR